MVLRTIIFALALLFKQKNNKVMDKAATVTEYGAAIPAGAFPHVDGCALLGRQRKDGAEAFQTEREVTSLPGPTQD